MLYRSGAIRTLGRVDHRNAFLDTDSQERERGITIFSKQAVFTVGDTQFTLLDTPGHVDFSAETERTLQVLDYAVLLISAADGVQGHTQTLWQLLRRYRVPTFLFINKMDAPNADRQALLAQLRQELDENCIPFDEEPEALYEQLALCDEQQMERYLQTGKIAPEDVRSMIAHRQVFPVRFGSALKLDGVDDFLQLLADFTRPPDYPPQFAARVFKLARDDKGARLTFLKVTGGSLKVRQSVKTGQTEEKIDQIRIYSGAKYTTVQQAEAGSVVAVTGLNDTRIGDGLGAEAAAFRPVLQPVLSYKMTFTDGSDAREAYSRLQQLEQEDPQLHLLWDSEASEIRVQLMGEVQMEILCRQIEQRFGLHIRFDEGSIVYKETIAAPVEGVGHYEPLRHYAEVHLLLEPGDAGSGLQFDTICSEDVLARNWQRLILTHLAEKTHRGVLTGSAITDLRITLLCGRAHLKHTEGGDFRQATYRAVRQGLKKAQSVLLEPWYSFTLELPASCVGRAMTDIQQMQGECAPPETTQTGCRICGYAPVAAMRGYGRQVTGYTHGAGRLRCTAAGYRPCREQETVVRQLGYDAERDLLNPAGSIFCDHGAGFEVKWNEVDSYAHLPLLKAGRSAGQTQRIVRSVASGGAPELEKELQNIFERTYGEIRRRDILPQLALRAENKRELIAEMEPVDEFLLVDGYNIIFAWDELNEIAKTSLDAARRTLMNLLCNYQGYRGCGLILVFDAYRVPQGLGTVEKFHNIYIVYTKEAETADQYIERVTYELRHRRKVRVATSDSLEQIIILGHNAVRVSAMSFYEEVMQVQSEIERILNENNRK